MKKKMLGVLLSAAMVASMLVGCGGAKTPETAAAPQTEAVTKAPATEAPATDAPATEAQDTEAPATEATESEAAEALPGGGSNILYVITPSHSNPFFGTEADAASKKAEELRERLFRRLLMSHPIPML